METAPAFAVIGFVSSFAFCSVVWLLVRLEGNRTVRLSLSIPIGLFIGLRCAVLGGVVAILSYPFLFMLPWPAEIQSFLLSQVSSLQQLDYQVAVGAVVLTLLSLLVGCVWIEAGRDTPLAVDPPFSMLAHEDLIVWSNLIDDPEFAPAFDALSHRQLPGKSVFKFIEQFAEQGNAVTQNNLGVMFEHQWFVKSAFEIFEQFAEQGNAAAQNNLGVMFETGFGVERSDAKAEVYLRHAAEQGVRTAQFNLAALLAGDLLMAGATGYDDEMSRKLVEGFKWARIAKAQHFPIAARGFRRFKKHMNAAEIAEGERLARQWLEQHGVQKQGKLRFLLKEAPRILRRELSSARRRQRLMPSSTDAEGSAQLHPGSRITVGFRRLGIVVGAFLGLGAAAIGIVADAALEGSLIGAALFLIAYGLVRLLGWIVDGFVSGRGPR